MLTNTQKIFRKQMKEIQEQLGKEEKEEYFSYIENDHIKDYYQPKKKTKFTHFPNKIMLILIAGIYVYTSYSHIIANWFSRNIGYNLQITVLGESQGKIADDIEYLENQNGSIKIKMKELKNKLDGQSSENGENMQAEIMECIQLVHECKIELHKHIFSKNVEAFKNAIDKYYSSQIHYLNSMQLYLLNKDNESFEAYNAAVNSLNEQRESVNTELENTFRNAGFQYVRTANGYQYTYQD